MKEISVIIPVYRESDFLPGILGRLSSQKVSKEIIVVIDEPTSRSLETAKKYRHVARFIINRKRAGKANALNKAAMLSSGKVLLFLDSDIEIPNNRKFLQRILDEIKDTDILGLKTEVVKDSLLARMTYYDYVAINTSEWLMAERIGRCVGFNGSAFAMKRKAFNALEGFRKAVVEDMDIGIRSFLKKQKAKYTKDIQVHNHVFSSWKSWLVQRKRWTTGSMAWGRQWSRVLLKASIRWPHVFIPSFLFMFPTVLAIMSIILGALFGWWLTATAFLSFSLVMLSMSKKLGYRFRLDEFFLYYFFYSFLWFMLVLRGFLSVFILRKDGVSDWKV